jgi:hypothetical protein
VNATNPSKGRTKNQKHFPALTRHGRSSRHGRTSGQRSRFHAQPVPPKRRVLCVLIQRRRARSPARSEIPARPRTIFDAGTATGTETDDHDRTPAELGWDIASSWNTRILQSYILEHYGVNMSREGIRKLLHRMRLSWTRPTYTLAKGDAEQQQAFEKQMDLIDTVLLYADETHVRSYQILRAA